VEKEQLEQIESRTRDLESEQNQRTVIDKGGGLELKQEESLIEPSVDNILHRTRRRFR
jgi:hypothetical protein